MKSEYINIPLVKNDKKKRFEININGHYAFINFGEYGDQIALVHTEVEPELEGKGAANAVVQKALQHIEHHKKSLLPFCPYVFAYIKKHPEWKRLVSKRFYDYDKL